jgi:hypothetical protein
MNNDEINRGNGNSNPGVEIESYSVDPWMDSTLWRGQATSPHVATVSGFATPLIDAGKGAYIAAQVADQDQTIYEQFYVSGQTPTLGDVWRQLVGLRFDSAIDRARIIEAIDRTRSGTSVSSEQIARLLSKFTAADQPKAPGIPGVTITLAAKRVSLGVVLICMLSLCMWKITDFSLINPAFSIILSMGAAFTSIVAYVEEKTRKRNDH